MLQLQFLGARDGVGLFPFVGFAVAAGAGGVAGAGVARGVVRVSPAAALPDWPLAACGSAVGPAEAGGTAPAAGWTIATFLPAGSNTGPELSASVPESSTSTVSGFHENGADGPS